MRLRRSTPVAGLLFGLLLVCGSEGRSAAPDADGGYCYSDVRAERESRVGSTPADEFDTYLEILVDAVGYDTTDPQQLLSSFVRRSVRGKDDGVGHAWLVLGHDEGAIECGHTGEFGLHQPRYFEGVVAGLRHRDPNPVAYLFEEMDDGRFQSGAGDHEPTAACRFEITTAQYLDVLGFIETYDYATFAMDGHLCTDFVAGAAERAGIHLGHQLTVEVPSDMVVAGQSLHLWSDPAYSTLTFGMPDVLAASLSQAAERGMCLEGSVQVR